MKRLKAVFLILLGAFLLFAAVAISGGFWCYRRFCDLDSWVYRPTADVVVRLRILRSFHPPVSFTVIRASGKTMVEACELPGPRHLAFWYTSEEIAEADWRKIEAMLAKIDVPSLATARQRIGLDGSDWFVSVRRGGRVEKAKVWSPSSDEGDPRHEGLYALEDLLNRQCGVLIPKEALY